MKTSLNQPPNWFHRGFLLFTAAFLYCDEFVPPATPIFTNADHVLNLHNATRMLDGQMIYRDFFRYTPPGTEVVYFALFKLFGVHAWIPNVMVVLLGLSLTWLCVFISRKVLSGFTAYLPGLMFLLIAFHSDLVATHHWYSVLAVTAALALIVEERSPRRLAGAAALCALASFFTQTRGVVAVLGLAIFLCWEHRKERNSGRSLLQAEAILAGVFSAVTLGLNLYFLWTVGVRRVLWCTVTFMVKYYPTDSASNSPQGYMAFMPGVAHWYSVPALLVWLFIYALLPLVYLLFLARCWSESGKRPDEPWDRLMLVSLMGLFLFAGAAPVPTYGRLCKESIPGLILFVWFIRSPGKFHFVVRQVVWLGGAVMLTVFALHRPSREWSFLDAPLGRVAFMEPMERDRYKWLQAHTHPSERFFDAGGEVYFLLGLRSPAEVEFLTCTDYTRPYQVRNLIESLEARQVPMVLWSPQLDPGTCQSRPGDHLGPIRDYLQIHYHRVKVFEDSEALERNELP